MMWEVGIPRHPCGPSNRGEFFGNTPVDSTNPTAHALIGSYNVGGVPRKVPVKTMVILETYQLEKAQGYHNPCGLQKTMNLGGIPGYWLHH